MSVITCESIDDKSRGTRTDSKEAELGRVKTKRSLGLCFSCDEKYTPGHRCRKPQLLLMEGEEEEVESDEIKPHLEEAEITLQSLTGRGSSKTLRVQSLINRQKIVALIDSGSTHNFVSEEAANKLNLAITAMKPFEVRVAGGHPLQCRGSYRKVAMDLGGASFVVDLFVLPLTGLDLVLGIQWLEILSPTVCDWKAQSMSFLWANEQRVIHGLQSPQIQQAQLEGITKESRFGRSVFALTIQKNHDTAVAVTAEMPQLLDDIFIICQITTTLPTSCGIAHHIVLNEGSKSNPIIVYLVMPSPPTFQFFMNSISRVHLSKFVRVFFEALLVHSSSQEELMVPVQIVGERLQQRQQLQFFVKMLAIVIAQRQAHTGQDYMLESLVKWKGSPREEATWAESTQLKLSFPELNLEDKVLLYGESNDETRGVRAADVEERGKSARVRKPNRKFLS